MLFLSNPEVSDMLKAVYLVIYLGSLVHVYIESGRVGDRLLARCFTVLMVAVLLWPLGYLFWLFYWPGLLRHRLLGTKPNVAFWSTK